MQQSPRVVQERPNYMMNTTSIAAKENRLIETNKKKPRARKTFMDDYKAQGDLHDRYSFYKVQKTKPGKKAAQPNFENQHASRSNIRVLQNAAEAENCQKKANTFGQLEEMSSSALIMRHFTKL